MIDHEKYRRIQNATSDTSRESSVDNWWFETAFQQTVYDDKNAPKECKHTFGGKSSDRQQLYLDKELGNFVLAALGRQIYENFTAEQKGDSFFLPCTMFTNEQKWNQREMGRVGRRYFPIFEKKFLFLQFHMEMAGNTGRGHWVLVIVQNPKYIFASSDNPDRRMKLIAMESMRLAGQSSSADYQQLESFAKAAVDFLGEWANLEESIHGVKKTGKALNVDDDGNIKYEAIFPAVLPHQHNDTDCGPYVLLYQEKFWEKADELFTDDTQHDFEDWFSPEEAFFARRRWRSMLDKMAGIENAGEEDDVDYLLARQSLIMGDKLNGRDAVDSETVNGWTEEEVREKKGYFDTYSKVRDWLAHMQKKQAARRKREYEADHPPRNARQSRRSRITADLEKMSPDEMLAWQIHTQLNCNSVLRHRKTVSKSKFDTLVASVLNPSRPRRKRASINLPAKRRQPKRLKK